MFYDPMIAKLITWAPTREAAIEAQVAALDRFEIDGLGHNVDFLSALMQHPRFREGRLTTGFIAEEFPEGFTGAAAEEALLSRLAAVAAVIDATLAMRNRAISGQLGDPVRRAPERVVTIGTHAFETAVEPYAGGTIVRVDDAEHDVVGRWRPGETLFAATIDGEPLAVRVERQRTRWKLTARGASHIVTVRRAAVAALSRHMIEKVPPDLSRFLLCPMPGLLTRLNVAEGDAVEIGQPLAVVEAMKMENILRAEKAGTVEKVHAAVGDSLAVDQAILELG